MNTVCSSMQDFIYECPTCFHTVQYLKNEFDRLGYTQLYESNKWQIKRGGNYYVTRNGSSVIAFRIPSAESRGFTVVASHSDSPSFKIKENAEIKNDDCVRLSVEKYGGMICNTWFDRPLSVAGRVIVKTKEGIETRLCNIDRDLLVIPSLAIHMNRKVNEGVPTDLVKDVLPLYAEGTDKAGFKKLIADSVGSEDILSADLYLYARQKGSYFGADNEFIYSPRLDDLECVYTSFRAFTESENTKAINVLSVFDNEEVGSETKQGAASGFLTDVLGRVIEALNGSASDYKRAVADSFMVSADNAHARHPNRPEYADMNHYPVMNRGIVIKYNANQRYTTDAVSTAIFTEICKRAGVPFQYYANRADLAGGSTLGSIANTKFSVNTVDIGLPQLAMHSACETAGALDPEYMVKALSELYTTGVREISPGSYSF